MKYLNREWSRYSKLVFCCFMFWFLEPQSVALSIGDRVKADGNVNVRPSAAGVPLSGSQSSGKQGTITAGPTVAILGGTFYTWYNIDFDSGTDGWVADIGLTLVASLQQPTGISATASQGGIQVNWTDNSTGESNYRVERKVGAGGFTAYATIAANSTSYNDIDLTPGTLYTYRVFAFLDTFASVFSPEASATTKSVSSHGLAMSPLSLTFSSSPRSVVDLLVAYTPAASSEAGGDASILNEIAAAVKQSNESYVNSKVNHRLRILKAESIDYTEAPYVPGNLGTGIGTDVVRLADPSDKFLGSIHSQRNQVGADVVALIEAPAGADPKGGIAKTMHIASPSFENDAFCVVRRSVMIGNNFGLPHEIGHIMGCGHDHAQAVQDGADGVGAFSYSYGYLLPGNRYGDIMSYPPPGASRIPHFSNPEVLYGGIPTGVPEDQAQPANNAHSMNNTAVTVAAFRDTVMAANIVTLSNTGSSSITVTSISPETSAPWLSVSPKGAFSISPNATQSVTVEIDYSLAPAGYSNTRLLVVTNGGDANPLPGGIAVIVDNDTARPTRVINLSGNLAFGNVSVGTFVQSTLSIANTGSSPLNINSISYPSGFSGNWSGTIPAGSFENVTVTFSPISTIDYSGNNLTVDSDATSGVNHLSVSGIGVSLPNLTVSRQDSVIRLTWPSDASGFVLEYTTGLPTAPWTAISISPTAIDGRYTLTIPITGENMFYRLKK